MLKKRKKGFTLVELLAVIVVLGVILTIAIPNILEIISQAKIDACEKQKDLIVDSARKYVLQSGNNITWTNNITTIYLSDLQNNNILPNPLKNPIGGNFNNTSSGVNVTVTRSGNEYSYVINNAICQIDNTKPVITLGGTNPLNVFQGDTYTDAGATASDNIDGNITGNIVVENNVDTATLGTYTVTYNVKDSAGNSAIQATRTVNVVAYTDYVVSKGVNKPRLTTGMTPIKWSSGSWVNTTADDTTWYDYSTTAKQWANARTADGSMWVWIPRYAYQISNYNSSSGTFNIKFLKDATDITSDGSIVTTTPTYSGSSQTNYIVHPAFTFGSAEITGIWVAKFEPSGAENAIDIRPNTTFFTASVGDLFTIARNMETNSRYGWGTTGNGIDTHMAKNIEWGAITYLTQSTYGKNTEVWINNSYGGISGCVGSGASASAYNGCQYTYNAATYGPKASTTGNVCGIYDISGGRAEYVAAYINNGSGNLTTYGNSIIAANSKYKDIYSIGPTDTSINNYTAASTKIGDAVYETSSSGQSASSWYGDYSTMPYSNNPWFARGGNAFEVECAGIYSFYFASGAAAGSSEFTFRPILLIDPNL